MPANNAHVHVRPDDTIVGSAPVADDGRPRANVLISGMHGDAVLHFADAATLRRFITAATEALVEMTVAEVTA